jgi:hypothetical protein
MVPSSWFLVCAFCLLFSDDGRFDFVNLILVILILVKM